VVSGQIPGHENNRKHIPEISVMDIYKASPEWLKQMTSELSPDESAVLGHLKNPLIRKHLIRHYEKCRDVNRIESNTDIFQIMDTVRLETFVRSKMGQTKVNVST